MNNLTKIAFVFIGNWVLGQVCQSTYEQNISWCIFITFIYTFFMGYYRDIWKSIKNEMRLHFG
jgi:hypothetical protein